MFNVKYVIGLEEFIFSGQLAVHLSSLGGGAGRAGMEVQMFLLFEPF